MVNPKMNLNFEKEQLKKQLESCFKEQHNLENELCCMDPDDPSDRPNIPLLEKDLDMVREQISGIEQKMLQVLKREKLGYILGTLMNYKKK